VGESEAVRRSGLLLVLLGGGLVCLVAVLTRARSLTEEDSINLARALEHYTVARDQPQAPGYPLVVLAAHAFRWIGSPVDAYQVVDVVATVFAIFMTFLLGREMFGRRAGVTAALIVCATPLVLYYASVASVYPTEMFVIPAVAFLAHRVATRADRWSAVLLFPVLALGGGFRPTTLVLMLPACLVGAVVGRPRARDVILGAAAGCAIVAAWAIPMIVKSGGWHAYRAASNALYERQFRATSILYGADLQQVAFNAKNTLGAILMVALPAVLVVLFAYRRNGSAVELGRPSLWILVASIVPYLFIYFVFQFGKPGYALAFVPLFAVLAGGLVANSKRAIPAAGVVAGLLILGYLTLPHWPLPWRLDAFAPTSEAIHVQDQEAFALRNLGTECPAASCTIVSLPGSLRYWYHEPSALAGWYAPASRVVPITDVNTGNAPSGKVLWIGTAVPQAVRDLATPKNPAGSWNIYLSSPAVTTKILARGI
jgi:4-amino-4-deoxy-L-arabinose transferase-like glycosyltransferase